MNFLFSFRLKRFSMLAQSSSCVILKPPFGKFMLPCPIQINSSILENLELFFIKFLLNYPGMQVQMSLACPVEPLL